MGKSTLDSPAFVHLPIYDGKLAFWTSNDEKLSIDMIITQKQEPLALFFKDRLVVLAKLRLCK